MCALTGDAPQDTRDITMISYGKIPIYSPTVFRPYHRFSGSCKGENLPKFRGADYPIMTKKSDQCPVRIEESRAASPIQSKRNRRLMRALARLTEEPLRTALRSNGDDNLADKVAARHAVACPLASARDRPIVFLSPIATGGVVPGSTPNRIAAQHPVRSPI